MRADISLAIAMATLGSGCFEHHHLEGASDVGTPPVGPASSDAGPRPSGDEGWPTRCLDEGDAIVVLGPERGCVSRTLEMRGQRTCEHQHGREVHGVPLRVARRVWGRTDMRVHGRGCDVHVRELSELACGRCPPGLGFGPPSIPLLFPEDDVLELLVAEWDDDDRPPCDRVDVEVCFDPDYGPPAWSDR